MRRGHPKVGENAVDRIEGQFSQNCRHLRERSPHKLESGILDLSCRRSSLGVSVEGDNPARWFQPGKQRLRMSSSSEGGINVRATRVSQNSLD